MLHAKKNASPPQLHTCTLVMCEPGGGAVPAVLDIMMDFALKLRRISTYIYFYNPAGFRKKF
jgi:hypothetical protein